MVQACVTPWVFWAMFHPVNRATCIQEIVTLVDVVSEVVLQWFQIYTTLLGILIVPVCQNTPIAPITYVSVVLHAYQHLTHCAFFADVHGWARTRQLQL